MFIKLLVRSFFFNYLKDVALLSSGCTVVNEKNLLSSLYVFFSEHYIFFLLLLEFFLFIYNFKQFDFNDAQCHFLYVPCAWGFIEFLRLFSNFAKFCPLFLKILFLNVFILSFGTSSYSYIRQLEVVPQLTAVLLTFFSFPIFYFV